MFPKTAAQFFQTREAGPRHFSQEPTTVQSSAETGQPDSRSRSARPPQTYIVSINGEEHKVTVTPAQG